MALFIPVSPLARKHVLDLVKKNLSVVYFDPSVNYSKTAVNMVSGSIDLNVDVFFFVK